MTKKMILVLSVFMLFQVGCAPYWRNNLTSVIIWKERGAGYRVPVGEVRVGDTKDKVLSCVGRKPDKVISQAKEHKEVWIFSDLSSGGRRITLTFFDDHLVKIDEYYIEGLL